MSEGTDPDRGVVDVQVGLLLAPVAARQTVAGHPPGVAVVRDEGLSRREDGAHLQVTRAVLLSTVVLDLPLTHRETDTSPTCQTRNPSSCGDAFLWGRWKRGRYEPTTEPGVGTYRPLQTQWYCVFVPGFSRRENTVITLDVVKYNSRRAKHQVQ